MAFSTQKDFFHVPFMNEHVDYECKRACVKLKSYDSSVDDRSWARDDTKKTQFLTDLVTCQIPTGDFGKGGDGGVHTKVTDGGPFYGGALSSAPKVSDNAKSKPGDFIRSDTLVNQLGNFTAGDSLLECANQHLADYQKIMNVKDSLEKQLEVSNERLKTVSEENRKIKEMMSSKLDSDTTKDFHNKIQKLVAAGKLTKNEENEMLQVKQKMENVYKAYEVLQAENNYLKVLIEKLSSRATIDQIKTEPETSADINYLQKEVNTLRKECKLLRTIEDNYHKNKQAPGKDTISDRDAENINAIIKERNSLREKCKSFKALQKTAAEMENKFKESDRVNSSMTVNLDRQAKYIKDMESEVQKMQKYYEDLLQKAGFEEQCLKEQLEDLKDELVNSKCKAQKAETLETEISSLRNALLQRDRAISDYDCQYKQLMGVVNELQSVKLQCLQDNHTQTCKNQTDDLAFFTCATLDEIKKELKKKGCIRDEFDSEYFAYGLGPEPGEFEDMKPACGKMCADAMKRLKELESENANLLNENSRIGELLKEGEAKMINMLKKIEHLDKELNKNGDELRRSYNELSDTKKLVDDISGIQLQNQQLANAVGAINSRDDEKIIDDLRRQLEEEMAKLKKCQFENNEMQKNIHRLKKEVANHKNGEGDEEAEKAKKGNNDEDDHIDHSIKDSKDTHKHEEEHTDNYNNKKVIDKTQKDTYKYNIEDGNSLKEKDNFKDKSLKHKQTPPNEVEALDDFVHKHVENLKFNFNKGRGFEKELRKILEEFIQECGFCFCRMVNPKSKLYAICHKLYHSGINKLSFRELAYLHKKIYVQAEELLPGCLLNMILTDNMDDAHGILNNMTALPRLAYDDSAAIGENFSEMTTTMLQKCCSCKNDLCCNKSEEMLNEKVTKLEKEIAVAQECLNTLKLLPSRNDSQTDLTEITDNNDSTYRAVSPVQKISSKQFKKLKTRLLKNTELFR